MPWHVENDHPDCSGYAVVKDSDGSVEGCHKTKSEAEKQLAALYANEPRSTMPRPPKDNLVRAMFPAVELRAAEGPDADPNAMPTMEGHFAVFNQWTTIDSMWEGRFLERITPGAFKKTFQEHRGSIRSLFQHGSDPMIGDKPLGPVAELEEDDKGARYAVPLLDASYVRDLVLPGLEAGLYGASFRFSVVKEDWDNEPRKSPDNPEKLPERSIREANVYEFGPVTFPAYAGATAGVRSLTDEFLVATLTRDPERLRALLASHALPGVGAGPGHSDEGSRKTAAPKPRLIRSEEDWWKFLEAI